MAYDRYFLRNTTNSCRVLLAHEDKRQNHAYALLYNSVRSYFSCFILVIFCFACEYLFKASYFIQIIFLYSYGIIILILKIRIKRDRKFVSSINNHNVLNSKHCLNSYKGH